MVEDVCNCVEEGGGQKGRAREANVTAKAEAGEMGGEEGCHNEFRDAVGKGLDVR